MRVAAERACLYLLALTLGAVFASDATAQGPGAVESEYKITLATPPVSEQDRLQLWRLIFGKGDADVPTKGQIDQKKCRRIEFLDTPEDLLHEARFALRRRAKLTDKECSTDQEEEALLTLKFRSLESTEASGKQGNPPFSGVTKLEQDLQLGLVNDQLQQIDALSLSKNATDARPATLDDARLVFPSLLDDVVGSKALGAGCRLFFEQRWELAAGPGAPAVALAIWQARGAGRMRPAFAELSFRSAAVDSQQGASFAKAAIGRLGAKWVGPPRSKTDQAYECASAPAAERK